MPEESPHHQPMLTGAERKGLFAGGGFEDQGAGPETFRGSAGEAAVGGSLQRNKVLPAVLDGSIHDRQHPGHRGLGHLGPGP